MRSATLNPGWSFLDEASAPGYIGVNVDLAIHQLRSTIAAIVESSPERGQVLFVGPKGECPSCTRRSGIADEGPSTQSSKQMQCLVMRDCEDVALKTHFAPFWRRD